MNAKEAAEVSKSYGDYDKITQTINDRITVAAKMGRFYVDNPFCNIDPLFGDSFLLRSTHDVYKKVLFHFQSLGYVFTLEGELQQLTWWS